MSELSLCILCNNAILKYADNIKIPSFSLMSFEADDDDGLLQSGNNVNNDDTQIMLWSVMTAMYK